jgi:ubiquinone/menaquinone biosynthesis C-methylase UbiE
MPDHKRVYKQEGDRYQQLVAREDYQENLLPALQKILDLKGLDVIDLGGGTGRLTGLLAPLVDSILVTDLSHHMLTVALEQLNQSGSRNWDVINADHRNIPMVHGLADLVISGWSFCYLAVWSEENWEKTLEQGLEEIKRLLRIGGSVIIIESLGTGNTEPIIIDKLAKYLDYLEKAGFQRSWIRTDYQFRDREEADKLVEFFFGKEMLEIIVQLDKPILPECTGIWHWSKNI